MPGGQTLAELYDEGYFHGKTSGYPAEGYTQMRDSWEAWLSLLAEIKPPPGNLVDLGAAYGYLLETAHQAGYTAFGCDISTYALQQERSLRQSLIQADVHQIPLATNRFDVVTIFDVLEHLAAPSRCLHEAARILSPGGVLAGATPDPIFFDRYEPTHCFERPPSYWVALLEELGLRVQFRFSVDPYNFQFLAAWPGSKSADRLGLLLHDSNAGSAEIINVKSKDLSRSLHVTPRFGWAPILEESRCMKGETSAIYLMNSSQNPLRLQGRLRVQHSPDFSTLRIRLDSTVLERLELTSESTSHEVLVRAFLLPSGGHHLFFDLTPGGPSVEISSFDLEAEEVTSSELSRQLPFDLQQRYCLAGEITRVMAPGSILDVGGYLGDQNGHLATSGDFLAAAGTNPRVATSDLRHCDHPSHHPSKASEQPFSESSFEMVVSLDVLEHLPQPDRKGYLRELDRVASQRILLGAPFYSPAVDELEASLAKQLQLSFLEEHREQGLPTREEIEEFFVNQRGYSIKAFPNGYLPVWGILQLLTQHLFSFQDHRSIHKLNGLYREHLYPGDQRQPAYRTIYLISKVPFTTVQLGELDQLLTRADQSFRTGLLLNPVCSEVFRGLQRTQLDRAKALNDVQFLINERQRAIRILTEQIQKLETTPLWKQALKRLHRILKGQPIE